MGEPSSQWTGWTRQLPRRTVQEGREHVGLWGPNGRPFCSRSAAHASPPSAAAGLGSFAFLPGRALVNASRGRWAAQSRRRCRSACVAPTGRGSTCAAGLGMGSLLDDDYLSGNGTGGGAVLVEPAAWSQSVGCAKPWGTGALRGSFVVAKASFGIAQAPRETRAENHHTVTTTTRQASAAAISFQLRLGRPSRALQIDYDG